MASNPLLGEPTTTSGPAGLSATAFSSLFQAVSGLRNQRAIVALLGCLVAGVLVAALLLAMVGTLGTIATLLAMLAWFVAISTGVNAAGLLQMDLARGISQRSTVDALVYGLMCIPKLIVLGLAFLAVMVAMFIAIALVMLVCKIPFLGPVIFVVAFPVCVVAAGVTVVGIFLCLVLSLPAIWQGASITRALAQTLAIVRSRLVEAVLLLLFVGFLSFVVGFIVFGVLGAGLAPTLAMSASILGFSGMGDMGSMMGMAQGFGGSGHVVAGVIGGLLLWAVAASLVGQVYLRGLSLVYLRVTEGLDSGATEAALRAGFDDARRRTAELGERARSAASRDVDSAPPPATTAPTTPPAYTPPPAFPTGIDDASAPGATHRGVIGGTADIDLPFDNTFAPATSASHDVAAPPAWAPPPVMPQAAPESAAAPEPTTCPQCLSPVTGEDVFCGICGYRLK